MATDGEPAHLTDEVTTTSEREACIGCQVTTYKSRNNSECIMGLSHIITLPFSVSKRPTGPRRGNQAEDDGKFLRLFLALISFQSSLAWFILRMRGKTYLLQCKGKNVKLSEKARLQRDMCYTKARASLVKLRLLHIVH